MSSYLSYLPNPPNSHLAVEEHEDSTTEAEHPTLQILEPAPLGDAASLNSSDAKEAESQLSQPQNTSSLGLTSHSLVYYLRRTQKYSSLTFAAFAALHLTNTALIPLATGTAAASNRFLLLTRPYYQSAVTEPLLVAVPLAAHIASGIALRVHRYLARRRWSAPRASTVVPDESGRQQRQWQWQNSDKQTLRARTWSSVWTDLPPLSWTSALGYLGIPLAYGHMALTRGLPLLVEGSSAGVGLDFVGHGVALGDGDGTGAMSLAGRLVQVVGVAGLVALVSVVGSHVVWGIATWLEVLPPLAMPSVLSRGNTDSKRFGSVSSTADARLKYKKRWWMVVGANVLVVGVWVAGGVGVVARSGRVAGWVGKAYDDMYRRVPWVKLALNRES